MKKTSQEKRPFVDRYGNRLLISAGVGGTIGAIYEAVSKKKRKNYLKTVLLSTLAGVGGGLIGEASLAMRRNVWEPLLLRNLKSSGNSKRTDAFVDRIVSEDRAKAEVGWREKQRRYNEMAAQERAKRQPAIDSWWNALRQTMGDEAFDKRYPDGPGPWAGTTVLPDGVDANAVLDKMPQEHRYIW